MHRATCAAGSRPASNLIAIETRFETTPPRHGCLGACCCQENWEDRANPSRSRRCNRGRTPPVPLSRMLGKARLVDRSGSQKTCPAAVQELGSQDSLRTSRGILIRGCFAARQLSRSFEVTMSPRVLRERATASVEQFCVGHFDNGELSCRSRSGVRVVLVSRSSSYWSSSPS